MKKTGIMAILLCLWLLAAAGTGYAGPGSAHIFLDGTELPLPDDVQVQIVEGSVMVPLRVVAEQLGCKVKWDNVTKTATIEKGGSLLKLGLNLPTAEASGKPVQLDTPAFLSGSTIFVPLRFVGEATGAAVKWDNVSKTVSITSPVQTSGGSVNPTEPPAGNSSPANRAASVTGISFTGNRLSISLDGSVSPTVFTMTGKDRIVIDLPNSGFAGSFSKDSAFINSQSGKLESTGSIDVSAVRYSLFSTSPSAVRVVMDLNGPKSYKVVNKTGLVMIDLNSGIAPEPTSSASIPAASVPAATPAPVAAAGSVPTPSATALAAPSPTAGAGNKKLVVIDAGHGGKDPGSISINNRSEKDFNLASALKIQSLFKNDPNIEIILTRSDDSYPTLQDRAKLANDLNADLFLSIHANSIPEGSKTSPSGTETYYTRSESLPFATIVHKYLASATGLPDRGIRQSSLYVTRETLMPAILLECGYLSSSTDEAALYTEAFQTKISIAIAAGIREYLGF